MDEDIKKNLKDRNSWVRGLYILLFVVLYNIAELVLMAIVIFQFGHKVITGKVSDKVMAMSKGLTRYIFQVLQYITFESEEQPFPFSDWPSAKE